MVRYRVAAVLLIIQGGLMELGGAAMLPLLLSGAEVQGFSFALGYLQQNLALVMVMGAIFGVLRIIGAIGLLRNRQWGLALSVINCVVTLALMMFMLPAGIADGLLSGTALVLILTRYYGTRTIG